MEYKPSGKSVSLRIFNYENPQVSMALMADMNLPLAKIVETVIKQLEEDDTVSMSKITLRVKLPNGEKLDDRDSIVYLDGGDRVSDYFVSEELPTEISYQIYVPKKGKGKKSAVTEEDKLNIVKYVNDFNDEETSVEEKQAARTWLQQNAAESGKIYNKIMQFIDYRAESDRKKGLNATNWTQFAHLVENWVEDYKEFDRHALRKQNEIIAEDDIVDFDLQMGEDGVYRVVVSEEQKEEMRNAYRYIKEFETKYAYLFDPNQVQKAINKLDLLRANSDSEEEDESHILSFDELLERYDDEEKQDVQEKMYLIYAIFIVASKPLTKTDVNNKWKSIFTRVSKYDRELIAEVLLSSDFKQSKKGFSLTAETLGSLSKDAEFKQYLQEVAITLATTEDVQEEAEDVGPSESLENIPLTQPLVTPAEQASVEEQANVEEHANVEDSTDPDVVHGAITHDNAVQPVKAEEQAFEEQPSEEVETVEREVILQTRNVELGPSRDPEPETTVPVETNFVAEAKIVEDNDEVDGGKKEVKVEYVKDNSHYITQVTEYLHSIIYKPIEGQNPLINNVMKATQLAKLNRVSMNGVLTNNFIKLFRQYEGEMPEAVKHKMFEAVQNALYVKSNDELGDIVVPEIRHKLATMFVKLAQEGSGINLMKKQSELSDEEFAFVRELKQQLSLPSYIETITTYLTQVEGFTFFTPEYAETLKDIIDEINSLQEGFLPNIENVSYSAIVPSSFQEIVSGEVTVAGTEHLNPVTVEESTDPDLVKREIDISNIEINEDAPDEDEIDE